MAQNREQLEKLLEFLVQLGQEPENAWFVEELKTRYFNEKKNSATHDQSSAFSEKDIQNLRKRISNIEKYLGLDFETDKADSTIDYSKIQDKEVRDQLLSDNREMMRYRYGTRSHKIDFYEFCKYAHFQAEMLLNYVYEPIGSATIEDCKNHISQFNKNAKFDEKIKTVSDISYSYKLWAFCSEFFHVDGVYPSGTQKQGKPYWTLNYVREARNEVNHRGTKEAAENNNKYYDEWLQKTPYDAVIKSLCILAERVQNINRQTFLIPPSIKSSAVVSTKLPSAIFLKMNNGEKKQVPYDFFKLIEDKQIGDIIQVEVDAQGNIIKLHV